VKRRQYRVYVGAYVVGAVHHLCTRLSQCISTRSPNLSGAFHELA
jgi:hypothetical protein